MMRVRVAATSANLGPGFDCLGLAVALDLSVTLHQADHEGLDYRGEGAVPDSPDSLIHQGFRAVFAELGRTAPTVRFEADNPIPLARGLGSSSAALVAGAALADGLAGGPLGREGVFQLAARLEGHPDNVAPAVFGGLTLSTWSEVGRFETVCLTVPAGWRLLFGIPDFELATAEARAVLPERYPRRDAVLTASRTALWMIAVLRDRPELLRTASVDVLHEPYREALVPGLAEARRDLLATGAFAAFLSGAGPTLGVICDREREADCRERLARFVGAGRVLAPEVGLGYRIASG